MKYYHPSLAVGTVLVHYILESRVTNCYKELVNPDHSAPVVSYTKEVVEHTAEQDSPSQMESYL